MRRSPIAAPSFAINGADVRCTSEHPDPVAERAVDVVDADVRVRQLLANVPTSPDVLRWIDRKVSQPVIGDPLPSRVKQAGRRWATRARSELEACDEVA